MKTYFLAKYALSQGIQVVKGPPSTDGYVSLLIGFFKLGRDIFETRAEAVVAAKALQAKKIASLQKQLAAVENMTF